MSHTQNIDTQASETDHRSDQEQNQQQQVPFWRVMLSVMQASYGVQNKKNKERDFQSGSIKGFIAAALIFTVIFVMTLVTIVTLVLP
jgi:hypothetical protein